MNNPKIIFMGTPKFAVGILDKLINSGIEIICVITAQDKIGGRGKKQVITSDVKKYALEKKLPILQPLNLKNSDFVDKINSSKPDFIIVVAFRMLPQSIWSIPKFGTINLHGSLLPKYRGAAPIQWAIINGEDYTGVTTFFIDENIDSGEILLQKKIKIEESDDSGTLHDKLMIVGAELMVETIQSLLKSDLKPIPQIQNEVSYAPKIFRETCKINFTQSTKNIYNFIRGLSPQPGAWTFLNGQTLKIFKSIPHYQDHKFQPMIVKTDGKNFLKIFTIDGWIEILELQIEGKKRMATKEFLIGNKGPFIIS
jgi:methionyl-tRNA formyltransferase